MYNTLENICLKTTMLEYLRTGEECYKQVIDYVNNGCKGCLYLYSTPITSLPEGLSVGGYLSLAYTKITSLPKGLKVGGILDLRNTPITSLPKGLKVGGNLYLHNTPISKNYSVEQLKQMLPNVRGEIYV